MTGESLYIASSVYDGESTGDFTGWSGGCFPPELTPRTDMTISGEGPVPRAGEYPPESPPYRGKFTVRLDTTQAAPTRSSESEWSCPLTGARVTFDIDAPTHHVSGTGTLTSASATSMLGIGYPYEGFGNSLDATLRYTARIVTAEGKPFEDRGTQSLRFKRAWRPSDDSFFKLGFTSDLAAVEAVEPGASDDTAAPQVKAPYAPFASPFARDSASAARNKLTWSASDPAGICRYELEQSTDGGTFTPVALATPITRATVRRHVLGHRYQYRVRATDCAGNSSAFTTARPFTVQADDATPGGAVSYEGAWSQLPDADSFNSTLTTHTGTLGSVTYTATMRRVALIAPRGPDRGWATVYVDGDHGGYVNLQAPSPAHRRVVWQKAWTTARPRTIQFQTYARVEIDAFATLP